ncbi:MAG: ELM1/GtrOC1 family putative glycosyltransferase [Gammaproteobacteria bacterium]
MAFVTQRILSALWPRPRLLGTFDRRDEPECLVLPVADGTDPSGKPPVRIFLGTELAQYRAERIFIWSIERVRDPSRVYEIYLMKELEGFDRRRWLTGFTNYRFAIPDFAGRQGRAIYNDVDQIYLSDPALLFDTSMSGHGYLSINDNDTSVMLIDCARMAEVWNLEAARYGRKNVLLASARRLPQLWGPLAGEWNVRDDEYAAGSSHLIHYTALHTQPWRPFPELFVYQWSSEAEVWHELERSADAAGYQVFTATHPSSNFLRLADQLLRQGTAQKSPSHNGAALLPEPLRKDLQQAVSGLGPGAMLEMGFEAFRVMPEAIPLDIASSAGGMLPDRQATCAICLNTLEYLPDEDIPWAVEQLFSHARQRVYAAVQDRPRTVKLGGKPVLARPRSAVWWAGVFEKTATHHPHIHWKLVIYDPFSGQLVRVREGGDVDHPPRVWVLNYAKPGHTTQSLGIAEALGWPYEIKHLHFNALAYIHRGIARLFGYTEATGIGLSSRCRSALLPPWPDVIIAAGWRPARVARWIAHLSLGRSRLVLLGRKGAQMADGEGVSVSCSHFNLPYHPQRLEIVVPPNRITPEHLAAAANRCQALFAGSARPRIGLLVGGKTELRRLDAGVARQLGKEVQAFSDARGGELVVITSRRTGEAATRALRRGLDRKTRIHEWRKGENGDAYTSLLAAADVLIVTGDSESMIAEAVTTGKPVYIYRLPKRRPGLRRRIESWVQRRAHARPLNRRGTVRPQQGLEYLCARLQERNIVQPPRDLDIMYQALVSSGKAAFFGIPQTQLQDQGSRPSATAMLAARVKQLLGYSSNPGQASCTGLPGD